MAELRRGEGGASRQLIHQLHISSSHKMLASAVQWTRFVEVPTLDGQHDGGAGKASGILPS